MNLHLKRAASSTTSSTTSSISSPIQFNLSCSSNQDQNEKSGSTSSTSSGILLNKEQESQSEDTDNSIFNNPKKRRVQKKITEHVVKTTKKEKEIFDVKVAKYIYASNTAFRQVESTEFKDMLATFRPGYVPPNRDRIANDLLDTVYNEVDSKLMDEMHHLDKKCTSITLCQDGWSSIHNDPIIASSVHIGRGCGSTFLLSAKESSTEKKTAEYCFQDVEESMELLKTKYGAEVIF